MSGDEDVAARLAYSALNRDAQEEDYATMSNLRNSTRLLNSSIAGLFGFGIALGLSGCSATSNGPRTGALSKMKTYLAVGDKPLPVVSGEPGSSITAAEPSDVDPPRPRRTANALGQISGRVFDRDGNPIPDARVRIAVSGASGGKLTRATTDRSGAFTLHGLRPGSSYTVIAESDADDGVLTGRAEAETSDTEVKITLESGDGPALRAGGAAKVGRVSDRAPASEDDPGLEPPAGLTEPAPTPSARSNSARRPAASSAVNEEDLPPATEADHVESNVEPARAGRLSASEAWRRQHDESARREPTDRRPSRVEDSSAPEDEGPNPLPPALEPSEAHSAAPLPPRDAAIAARTSINPSPPTRAGWTAPPNVNGRGQDSAVRQPPASATDEPTPEPSPFANSEPFEQGSKAIAPESFAPIVFEQDPFASERARLKGLNESEAASAPAATPAAPPIARAKSDRVKPASTTPPEASAPTTDPDAIDTPRKQTWRELSQATTQPPPLEGNASLALASSDAKTDRKLLQPSFRTTKPARADARPPTSTATASETGPLCEYDDRLRRIVDFRLPSLDGKSVRLSDIDADLILLDFWGTWCDPCLRSIPHLVDLQNRMGKKIAVIGIACEPDGTDAAVAKVAETVERLKINYPVLISRNDGKCPVQEALHIQAFPTMILITRSGQIVWRDQGATASTLARLDRRILEASPKPDATRRY